MIVFQEKSIKIFPIHDEVIAKINTIIAKLRDLKSNITVSSELEAFKVGKGLIEKTCMLIQMKEFN